MQKERGSNKSKVMWCYFVFFCQPLAQVHLFFFPPLCIRLYSCNLKAIHIWVSLLFLLPQEFWLGPLDSSPQTLFWEGCRRKLKAANVLPVNSAMWYQGVCVPYQKKIKNRQTEKKNWTLHLVFEFTGGRNAWNWSQEQNYSSKACLCNWISSEDFKAISIFVISTFFLLYWAVC